jgi:hypothetical protein
MPMPKPITMLFAAIRMHETPVHPAHRHVSDVTAVSQQDARAETSMNSIRRAPSVRNVDGRAGDGAQPAR